MTRWDAVGDAPRGADYARRFERLAAAGADVHGEATCVDRLAHRVLGGPARVLDAGCGTGRVAIRLAELGHTVTGVDVDPAMLAHARAVAPDLTWVEADLASPDLPAGPFDVVVAAGNVVPLLSPGTEPAVLAAFARRAPVLVAGFGLDPAHLPLPEAPFDLTTYDAWCAAAGWTLAERWSTWDGAGWDPGAGYAVSVHVTGGMGVGLPRALLYGGT